MTQTAKLGAKPAIVGAAYMVGAGAIFALINTMVQSATMQFGVASTKVAFWQYLVAFGFCLPWIWRQRLASFETQRLGLHGLRVALAAAGVQVWVYGLAFVPIWQAIALIMTSPFFVALGAGLFLRERVTLERWIAVATGFLGGMVILAPWSDQFSAYGLLPVLAAALWAASSLLTKSLTRTDSPATLTIYLLLLLTPINAVVTAPQGFAVPLDQTFALIVLAGALTAAAQYTLVKAYSVADAAFLQPFDHVKLPLNVLLGFLAFGFLPNGNMWWGSILIVGASLYLLRDESRR